MRSLSGGRTQGYYIIKVHAVYDPPTSTVAVCGSVWVGLAVLVIVAEERVIGATVAVELDRLVGPLQIEGLREQ